MSAPAGFQYACATVQLCPGQVMAVELQGVALAVVNSNGEFFALQDRCSHANVALSEGELTEDGLECWLHGSCFNLQSGRPLNLPATEPVAVFPVAVVDGRVYVNVNSPSTPQPQ